MNKNDYLRVFTLCAIMLICAFTQASAAATVVYKEEMRTYTSQGYVRVGRFEVNGKTAFCMEHSNESPPTGTEVTEKVYQNEKIRKILYYGWEGPGQWSGFADSKQGITLTSLLLSETYTTAQPVGTYNFVDGLVGFRNYVNSQPAPDLELKFSKSTAKAFYDKELDAERTEDITVVGSGAGKLTIKLPDNIMLHNNTTEEELAGSAALSAGDSFYLRTIKPYSDDSDSQVKGKNFALQPLVFVTASTALQDLTRLEYAEDVAETTKLTVDWIGLLDVKVTKKDADTGKLLPGAKYYLCEIDENGREVPDSGTTLETKGDGTAYMEKVLQCGRRYKVVEKVPPFGYVISKEEKIIEPLGEGLVELTFENEKQFIYIKVNKTGEKYKINSGRVEAETVPLESVSFDVEAAEDIYDWGGTSVLYKRGTKVASLVTDKDGIAITEGLPPGKYSIFETGTAKGYTMDREVRTYNLNIGVNEKELVHTIDAFNNLKETELVITKLDTETKKPLGGARFRITNSEGQNLEVVTGKSGNVRLRNLPPGDYSIVEVEAPRGYELETKSQRFTIENEGENASVKIEAFNKRVEAPRTGDKGLGRNVLYAIMMITAILIFVRIWTQRKRMKNR